MLRIMVFELVHLDIGEHPEHENTVWHSHPLVQIGYVLEGACVVHFHERSLVMRPRCFYFIAKGHLHRIENLAGNREYHCFVRKSRVAGCFSRAAVASAGLGWLEGNSIVIRGAARLRTLLTDMESLWRRGDPASRLASQCLLLRLMILLESLDPQLIRESDIDATPLRERKSFQMALKEIERAYARTDFRVNDVAAACFASRSYLDKLFHRHVGHGPREFIQRYRVDRGKELLQLSQVGYLISMKEIAQRIGFPDIFAFSRVFKRITGRAPSSYRKT